MKTSYKLLIAFAGFLSLLLLIANTVIWANYKRGYTGRESITVKENTPSKFEDLPPFKVLKLQGIPGHGFPVIKTANNRILFTEHHKDAFLYTIQNDTMILNLKDNHVTILECNQLTGVVVEEGSALIQDFQAPAFEVTAAKGCDISLFNIQTDRLSIQGGESINLSVQGGSSRIDTLQVTLGRGSVVNSHDVPYGHVMMDVSNLSQLNLTGASLNALKQIR